MAGIAIMMRRAGMTPHPSFKEELPSKYVRFADPLVEEILMAHNVSSDGIGITKEDCEAVTSVGTWFRETDITSFNEFALFKNVTTLEENSFRECRSLKTIDLTNITTICICCFINSDLSEYDLYMPNCEYMGGALDWSQWFMGTSLRSIRDTGKLSSFPGISSGEKYGCFTRSKVKEAYINGYVKSIGAGCFANCEDLEKITFAEGLQELHTDALSGCIKLKNLVFPTTLRAIGNYAAPELLSTEYVIFLGETPPSVGGGVFDASRTLTFPIYVPDNAVDAYKATGLSEYGGRIKPLSEFNGQL